MSCISFDASAGARATAFRSVCRRRLQDRDQPLKSKSSLANSFSLSSCLPSSPAFHLLLSRQRA